MSVHEALVAALPPGSVCVKRYDHLVSRQPAPPAVREEVLLEETELDALSRSKVVCGHFHLATLLRVAPPKAVATVLREPRARILSVYAFWRLIEFEDTRHLDRPYDHALRPLDEYLSEPLIAGGIDNVVCRFLVDDAALIGEVGFIPAEHIEDVAADAIDRLDRLGFVGVLERGEAMWEGLSRFFDVTLEPTREMVTAALVPDAAAVYEPISERTLELLHARTAADAIVYDHVLTAKTSEAEAKRISDAAFAAQLVRFGDVAGRSAAAAQSLTHRLAEAESQIATLTEQVSRGEEELARHRAWLEGIQRSVSWRMTGPLRAAKRRVLTASRRKAARRGVPPPR